MTLSIEDDLQETISSAPRRDCPTPFFAAAKSARPRLSRRLSPPTSLETSERQNVIDPHTLKRSRHVLRSRLAAGRDASTERRPRAAGARQASNQAGKRSSSQAGTQPDKALDRPRSNPRPRCCCLLTLSENWNSSGSAYLRNSQPRLRPSLPPSSSCKSSPWSAEIGKRTKERIQRLDRMDDPNMTDRNSSLLYEKGRRVVGIGARTLAGAER